MIVGAMSMLFTTGRSDAGLDVRPGTEQYGTHQHLIQMWPCARRSWAPVDERVGAVSPNATARVCVPSNLAGRQHGKHVAEVLSNDIVDAEAKDAAAVQARHHIAEQRARTGVVERVRIDSGTQDTCGFVAQGR